MLNSIFLGAFAIYFGYCFVELIGSDKFFKFIAVCCGLTAVTFGTAAFGNYTLLVVFTVIVSIVMILMQIGQAMVNREEKRKASR